MKNPLVSIIIPTYNRQDLLPRAIKSCLQQSYEPCEILVVDDGSTDKTAQVVAKLQKKIPSLRYLHVAKNQGEVAARNYGILHAHGKLLTFLDSDDELTPAGVAMRVHAYQDSRYKTPLIYGDFTLNGAPHPFVEKQGWQYPYLMKELALCGIVAVLLNRQALLAAGLPDPRLPSWGDDDLIIGYCKKNPVVHVPKVVANIHTSTDSVSINQTGNRIGLEILLKKYARDIVRYQGNFRLFLWRIRLFRLQILAAKAWLHAHPHPLTNLMFFLLRIGMYVLDKCLYLFFDNLYV